MKDKFSAIIIAISILVGSILISLSIWFSINQALRTAVGHLLFGLMEVL